MKHKVKKLKEVPQDLGKELACIKIEACVHEQGLHIALYPDSMPEALAQDLSNAITQVLISWNEKFGKEDIFIN